MANPHQTDAHLRVAHSILEQIMVSDFSKRRLSILLFILRLSWGCGKKEAVIPQQGDFEIVGVSSGHVKAELDWLIEAKVIYRNGNLYNFNKDYDQWRVSRANGYRQDKITEMVSLNIKESYQSCKSKDEKVTKVVSRTYQNSKSPTPSVASPKENLKKVLKKHNKVLVGNFNIFWDAYPKKVSKGQAEKAFFNIQPDDELLGIILGAIEQAKKSVNWCKENGRYIQNPATWLNAKGWEDEINSINATRKVGDKWNVR